MPRAFTKAKTQWQLERESEVVNLKETVMIPDFTFRHPDGRIALLEIMGYWRPEYLRRKLEKLRQAQRKDLLVAVSSNLNVSEDDFKNVPGGVFFFSQQSSAQRRHTIIGPDRTARDWANDQVNLTFGNPTIHDS